MQNSLTTQSFEMKKLKEIRSKLGLTQSEMARIIQKATKQPVNFRHVAAFENNKTHRISEENAELIERWVIKNHKLSEASCGSMG